MHQQKKREGHRGAETGGRDLVSTNYSRRMDFLYTLVANCIGYSQKLPRRRYCHKRRKVVQRVGPLTLRPVSLPASDDVHLLLAVGVPPALGSLGHEVHHGCEGALTHHNQEGTFRHLVIQLGHRTVHLWRTGGGGGEKINKRSVRPF